MADLILSQTGPTGPKPSQNSAKITPRQAALATGRQAVNYLLHGEPEPNSFDRTDLENAAAVLGLLLAETESGEVR